MSFSRAPDWSGAINGLVVQSEIDLGWVPAALTREPDLRIVVGESRALPSTPPVGTVIAAIDEVDDHFYTAVATGQGDIVRFYGCADFVISPDRTLVTVFPDLGVSVDDCAPHLVGTVVAYVVARSGTVVLHASAVTSEALHGGKSAVALVAGTGGGKTTLATIACAGGALFVTDDVLSFAALSPAAIVHRGSAEARLRQPAEAVLAQFATPPPKRLTADGRVAVGIGGNVPDELPLVAGLVPSFSGDTKDRRQVQLRRLDPYESLMTWTRSPRLSGWRDRSMLALHFSAASALARTVPLYAVELPAGVPDTHVVHEALEALEHELSATMSNSPGERRRITAR